MRTHIDGSFFKMIARSNLSKNDSNIATTQTNNFIHEHTILISLNALKVKQFKMRMSH